LLLQVNYAGKDKRLLKPNADIVFTFTQVGSLEK